MKIRIAALGIFASTLLFSWSPRASLFLSSFHIQSSQAAEADLFTQPPGLTPKPAPTDSFGAPIVKSADFFAVAATAPSITVGSAYAAGQCIGNLLTFSAVSRVVPPTNVSAGSADTVITSIVITDKAGQSAPLDIIFILNSAGTYTDKTNCAITGSDAGSITAAISVLATDYTSNVGTGLSVATKQVTVPMQTGALASLRAVLVSRGTPTYVTTSDLQVRLTVRMN